MGAFSDAGRDETGLSWTNESLPLEVRRALLDKALEDLKLARAAGMRRAGGSSMPDRPGQSGADRESAGQNDKPQA